MSSRTGTTALMKAATDPDPMLLLRMLSSGRYRANLWQRDRKGRTALDWARMSRNYQAVTLLLKAMASGVADTRLQTMEAPMELEVYVMSTNKLTTQALLDALKRRDSERAMRILADNQLYREEVENTGQVFFVDTAGHSGYTPLIVAAGFNMIEVVDRLLEYRTPVDCTNKFGHTPFTYACAAGNSDVARLLLFNGADVHHVTHEGRTGLHYACMYAKARTVKVVLAFMLERFATFRIEGHSMVNFDPSRWTTYAEIMERLLQVRDKHGQLATDLIPTQLGSSQQIESNLRVRGVKTLDRLLREDEMSLQTNRDFASQSSSMSPAPSPAIGMRGGRQFGLNLDLGLISRDLQELGQVRGRGDVATICLADDDISAVSDLPDDFSVDPVDRGLGLGTSFAGIQLGPSEEMYDKEGLGEIDYTTEDQVEVGDHPTTRNPTQSRESTGDLLLGDLDLHALGAEVEDEDASRASSEISMDFSYDTDAQHATGIHNITDAHSVATALPLDNEVHTIQALFADAQARIAEWLHSAQKESALAQLTPCILRCGDMCTVESLTHHMRDVCPRRSLQCVRCHKAVPFIDLKAHNVKHCRQRAIACPNAYKGCTEMTTPDAKDQHTSMKCRWRRMNCRQFCGAMVPYAKREDHETHHCRNRPIFCDQCSARIVAATYTHHLHNDCPQRKVHCPVSCGAILCAHECEAHVRDVCVRPCKWGCGRRIGPPELLVLHEATSCPDKPCVCEHLCGTHLTLKDVDEHMALCPQRPLVCPQGCGETIVSAQLSTHMETWLGSCTKRAVRCPSNLVGWRIMLFPENLEGIVMQYKRQAPRDPSETGKGGSQADGSASPSGSLVSAYHSLAQGCSSGRGDEGDRLFVRFDDQQLWIDPWSRPFTLLSKVMGDHGLARDEHLDQKFQCGWLVASGLSDHLHYNCGNREVYLLGEKDKEVEYVGQKSAYKDASTVASLRGDFDSFVQADVDKSTDFCGFCSQELPSVDVEEHQTSVCPEFITKCPYVCGKELRRCLLDVHLKDDCSKRLVLCIDCNSTDLWAEELQNHQTHMCDMRLVPCPLKCGVCTITACAMDTHAERECELRVVQCTCGQSMPFCELDEHHRLNCNNRFYFCPQGCGERIQAEYEEYHVEFKCSNKNFKYQKEVECPNSCGAFMMVRDVLTHLSYVCARRMVECSLNCGNSVQLDRLALHITFCPMRVMSCEPGQHACNRPIHLWFRREEEGLGGRGVEGSPTMQGIEDAVVEGSLESSSVERKDEDLSVRGGGGGEGVYGGDEPDVSPYTQRRSIAQRVAHTAKLIDDIMAEDARGVNLTGDEAQSVVLFQEKGVRIQYKKKGSFFQSLRVEKLDRDTSAEAGQSIQAGSFHQNALRPDSSVFRDGFSLKFHGGLRMHQCKLHGQSVMISAIRHNNYALGEMIAKHIRDSEDIDFENVWGDTALTLACRYGRLDFIELLVEHAADVNKESSNGRTPLIETVKASVESVPIMEYLLQQGAIVNYKTNRHGHTAMHWAKLMRRHKTVRILDLAEEVQLQANKIFFAIARGKVDLVRAMVDEGDFFDANGEAKFYAEMKRYADLEDDTHDEMELLKDRMEKKGNAVGTAHTNAMTAKGELEVAQAQLLEAFGAEDAVNRRISKDFSNFEQTAAKLAPVVLEEIVSLRRPDYLLRLCVFGFGVVFGSLDSDDWSDCTPCNVQSSLQWWPIVTKELVRSREVVRKIQCFTVGRLEGGRALKLILRAQQLFKDIVDYLAGEKRKRVVVAEQGAEPGSLSRTSSFKSSRGSPGASLSGTPGETSRAGSASVGAMGELSAQWELAEIKDEDWDSEADEAGEGSWEKGEWVAVVKKKKNWWERELVDKAVDRAKQDAKGHMAAKAKSSRFIYLSDAAISSSVRASVEAPGRDGVLDMFSAVDPLYKLSVSTLEEGALLPFDDADSDAGSRTSRHSPSRDKSSTPSTVSAVVQGKGSRSRSRGSRGRNKRLREPERERTALEIPILEHLGVMDLDTLEALPFIETMFALLKAVVRFAEDQMALRERKKDTSLKSIHAEDLKITTAELHAKYDKEYALRADNEMLLIDHMRKERFYKQRLKSFREKVRVARLLNQVSVSGHTALSWAASLGAYEIVEDLLSHGASVGFTANMMHLTATFLQYSYKIYRKNCLATYRHPEDSEEPTPKVDSIQMVRDIGDLKEKREKVFTHLRFLRSKTRFPVPEACYAGKWEIIERIYDRRLYHAQFSNTWVFPSAPYPYLRKHERAYDRSKMSLQDVLMSGMNDNAAGCYVQGIGWVGPNDHREPFGETQEKVADILRKVHNKKMAFLAARKRIRLLALERRNQVDGEKAMLRMIKNKDFRSCMKLAKDRGITIDLETPEGYTVLLGAAEENTDAVNHQMMENDDGRLCLQVEYLLDRAYYRPAVNLEGTVSGHTALIRACVLNRAPVVEALLDRGADINYQNRTGRTALHYAASKGDATCVRILIERFADKTLRDNNGQTAYEIADSENFSNIMKLLSQFQTGFLGQVQISRGRVNNIVKCPLGCGMNMIPREQEAHCIACEWRSALCPNDCGDNRLMAKELPDHLEFTCSRREVECVDCDEKMRAREMDDHLKRHCAHRIVPCMLGCGYDCKLCDMDTHMLHCAWRTIACPLDCPIPVKAKDAFDHARDDCENRRVACPYRCRGLVVAKLLGLHMELLCVNRPALCQFCSVTLTKNVLESHERECPQRLVPCMDRCGESVPFNGMLLHLHSTCTHRFEPCPLACGVPVRVANVAHHCAHQCPERKAQCENRCVEDENVPVSERVVSSFKAKTMALHLKYDCPERTNRCSLCLQQVKAKNATQHEREQCPQRKVFCRVQGCLKELGAEDLDQHERFTCRFRLVPCKQTCGERVPAIRLGVHMTRTCPLRFIKCELGCGVEVRASEMDEHTALECMRRHGAGSTSISISRAPAREGKSSRDERGGDDNIKITTSRANSRAQRCAATAQRNAANFKEKKPVAVAAPSGRSKDSNNADDENTMDSDGGIDLSPEIKHRMSSLSSKTMEGLKLLGAEGKDEPSKKR